MRLRIHVYPAENVCEFDSSHCRLRLGSASTILKADERRDCDAGAAAASAIMETICTELAESDENHAWTSLLSTGGNTGR